MIEHVESIVFSAAEAVFGVVCHQDPSIVDAWPDARLALCPRCLGLQLSAAWTLLMALPGRRRMWRPAVLVAVAIAALVAPLHWLLALADIVHPTPIARLVTGCVTGFALASMALRYARSIRAVPLESPSVAQCSAPLAASALIGASVIDVSIATNVAALLALLVNACLVARVVCSIARRATACSSPRFHPSTISAHGVIS